MTGRPLAVSVVAEAPRSRWPFDTTLTRALAIALIFNSHLEAFYPRAWLAGGGLWGNTTFFLISGVGIALSRRTYSEPAGQWYARRLKRIYPAPLLAGIVLYGLIGGHIAWEVSDLTRNLLWPTRFSYVGQIVLWYAVGFFLLRVPPPQLGHRILLLAIGALLVPIGITFANAYGAVGVGERMHGPHLATAGHWLVNLQTFLIGLAIGVRRPTATSGVRPLVLFGVIVVAYLALKLAVATNVSASRLYPVLLPMAQLLAVATLMACAHRGTQQVLERFPRAHGAVTWLSNHTLEIYVTHFFFVEHPAFIGLPAPLGLVATLAASLVTSALLKPAGNRLVALGERVFDKRDASSRTAA